MNAPIANRRRPRFTLRSVAVGVTLVALALAWWAHGHEQSRLVAALVKSNPGAHVVYDDELSKSSRLWSWVAGWLPRDQASNVVAVELFYPTDEELRLAARFSHLETLKLERAIDVTVRGLAALKAGSSLKQLLLGDGWNLDDAALTELAQLSSLERLTLDAGPRVTALGVMQLASLAHIERLQLNVADDEAAEAIDQLRERLPRCQINAVDAERVL